MKVIVVGVGGIGSATCYHLAKLGADVVGLEQFSIAHDQGSSHGETRLIRQAYFEHPNYVPLLLRAYTLWDELADAVSLPLIDRRGVAIFGEPDSGVLRGVRESSQRYSVKTQEFSGKESRFSPLGFSAGEGIFEPTGGFLQVEACVASHVRMARKFGAEIHESVRLLDWSIDGAGGVTLNTSKGEFRGDALVLTTGAWLPGLSELPLTIHRNYLYWFRAPETYETIPCFAYDLKEGFFYGFPRLEGMVKVACHRPGEKIDTPTKIPHDYRDLSEVKQFVECYLPGLSAEPVKTAQCFYTMSPDEHFIVDKRSDGPVWFGGGFSGHGFKFSSVMGENIAKWVIENQCPAEMKFLGADRLIKD